MTIDLIPTVVTAAASATVTVGVVAFWKKMNEKAADCKTCGMEEIKIGMNDLTERLQMHSFILVELAVKAGVPTKEYAHLVAGKAFHS